MGHNPYRENTHTHTHTHTDRQTDRQTERERERERERHPVLPSRSGMKIKKNYQEGCFNREKSKNRDSEILMIHCALSWFQMP